MMTNGFLVFSLVAQVMLWIFAMTQIEKARAASWRIYEKEQKLDDIVKSLNEYLGRVDDEQECIQRSLRSLEKLVKIRDKGDK